MGECRIQTGARGECWIPPGHVTLRSLVEQRGAEKMREDLYLGRCAAFEWNIFTGELRPIAREEWAAFKASFWLGLSAPLEFPLAGPNANDRSLDNILANDPAFYSLLSNDPALYTFYLCPERILVRIAGKPVSQPSLDGQFIPEFVALMLEAIRHFGITDDPKSWPKKEELKQYFLEQKLSTGAAITDTPAFYLAMFCRPLAAMRGGNKRA